MNAYTNFAQVYDLFMDDIPYEEWCCYITDLLKDYQIEHGILLDLGCGTGNLTELLSKQGFDMIGIDNSFDMLEIAIEKKERSGQDILYLLQDMREFELYGTVSAVVSICDSINYILSYEDLVQVFRLVNNYLDPEGIFIFDLNTEYKYTALLADNTIAENRDKGSFIWENYYYPEEKINEYDLTLFIQTQPESEDLYQKFVETHYQRCYSLKEIKSALNDAGLEFLVCYDAFTKNAFTNKSERVYVIAREKGKKKGI